jgi:hypothetical protein
MVIYSRLMCLVTRLFRIPDIEHDIAFDSLIQDALFDDALACPSRDAWDRLRQVIVERQIKHYGMWVLDEPQREPPEYPPTLLNGHDVEYARCIYGGYLTAGHNLRRDLIWGGLSPTFSVITSW